MISNTRKKTTDKSNILHSMEQQDFEELVFLQNRKIGLRAIVCIHDTRNGPAHGGIRCITYRSEHDAIADAMRLAHAMSRKAAIAGIPAGGGKAVIINHPGLNRRAAYETLGRFIENWGGRFFTGPDVGTTERDLAALRRHTRFVVKPQKSGRPGHVARATVNGVISSIRATWRFLYGTPSPADRVVAVQGLGAIGGRVADWLWSEGAKLIVAEVDPGKLRRWRGRDRVRVTTPGRILSQQCDLLSPNALGGIISARTPLHCRAIVGAANNPLFDAEAAAALHRRGILFAPDFLVNAGGLIEGAVRHLGFAAQTEARITGIGDTLLKIFRRAAKENKPPYEIAIAIADARLKPGKSPGQLTMRREE